MSELSEQAKWEKTIYQIQRGDDVSGGRDGVANIQARQLANRTALLKNDVDKLNTSVMSDAKIYDNESEAQQAINDGMEKRQFFTVTSQITNYWVEQYENVNGIAVKTGKKIVTSAFVEAVELLAAGTDKRTRGLLTLPRSKYPFDIVSRQGYRLFAIKGNGDKSLPGNSFADYLNVLKGLIVGQTSVRRVRPGYLFDLVVGGYRLLSVRDDGRGTLEHRGIPVENHLGLLENTLGFLGDSLSDNGHNPKEIASRPRGWTYNARSWQTWAVMKTGGRLKYVGQWATGGYTSGDVIKHHLQSAIEAKPRFCGLLIGRNDVIRLEISLETTKANVRTICTALRKAGIIPVICSMAAQINASDVLKGRENAVNAFLRAYALDQGYPFVDIRAVTVDPATDAWKPGYNGILNGGPDPSHPAPLGAFHMGTALAETLAPYTMPTYPPLAIANTTPERSPNGLRNPLFLNVDAAGSPADWVVESGDVSVISAPDIVGNALAVKASSGTYAKVSQVVKVKPGERREFCFKVKTDTDDKSTVACYCETNDANTVNLAGLRAWSHPVEEYLTYSYEFIVPADVEEIKVVVAANNAADIYIGQAGVINLENAK